MLCGYRLRKNIVIIKNSSNLKIEPELSGHVRRLRFLMFNLILHLIWPGSSHDSSEAAQGLSIPCEMQVIKYIYLKRPLLKLCRLVIDMRVRFIGSIYEITGTWMYEFLTIIVVLVRVVFFI